jgi:hypothetical protein
MGVAMFARRFGFACVLAASLAACQPAQNGDPASIAPAATAGNAPTNSTSAMSATAGTAAPAAASASTTGEHAATRRYKIDIGYPRLSTDEAPLGKMLHRIAANARRDFMQALPDPKLFPEFADRQMQLLIDFKIAARTPDFVSVRETGMQDTGGAHPIPIDATIVYDAQARRTVTLDDLFSDADTARKALADYARAGLTKKIMAQAPRPGEGSPEAIAEWKTSAQKMIDDGTRPTQQNFANFIVRAPDNPLHPSPGLVLIFPPYQVAAYVYGTQTVSVPITAFAQYLKPQYRNAFGVPVAN